MVSEDRYSFIDLYLQDMVDVRQTKGVIYLVPFVFCTCFGLGAIAAYFVPVYFFAEEMWDVSSTIYSGILAFNAITLALSWSALGRILEILSRPNFSAFLKSSGMLNKYSFYISFIHATQIFASVVTLVALIVNLIPTVPILVAQSAFAAVVGFTLYALRWSLGSVRIMGDLIRNFAKFDGLDEGQKRNLRLAVDNGG